MMSWPIGAPAIQPSVVFWAHLQGISPQGMIQVTFPRPFRHNIRMLHSQNAQFGTVS